ncbi:MAG: acyl carrier protein [Symploca sp. SIO2G7]|nr:acyl carrier protein [Symploca sp. SIO2G7]
MTTETKEISSQVKQFILDTFPRARQQSLVEDDALLGSNLVDSLGVLDLVAFVETEFQITVCDDELVPENFQTIQCITNFVKAKLNSH